MNNKKIENALRIYRYFNNHSSTKRVLRLRKDAYENIFNDVDEKEECNSKAYFCKDCDGTGYNVEELADISREVDSKRLPPNEQLDQCLVIPEDLSRRVAYIFEFGDISGKKILHIGDDDLTSVMISKVAMPAQLTVIDTDEKLLEKIQENIDPSTCLETVKFDIRTLSIDNIPVEMETYDTFITDPPYTEVGVKYFLSLAAVSLKRGGIGYIIVPYMDNESWTEELLLQIHKFLIEYNFVIIDQRSGFQMYQHEQEVVSTIIRVRKLGYCSNLLKEIQNLNVHKFYTTRYV